MRFKIFVLALLTVTSIAHAKTSPATGFLSYRTEAEIPEKALIHSSTWLLPNERYPLQGKDVYGAMGKGVLISVGTERGPIALTLAPNVTHLLQLDMDPAAVVYNRANIALLKAAARTNLTLEEKMATYLRWKFEPKELAQAASTFPISEEEKNLLLNLAKSPWWTRLTQMMKEDHFHSPTDTCVEIPSGKTCPKSGDRRLTFAGVKYWKEKDQAEKLFSMANENRMQAELVDLRDRSALTQVADGLKAAGLPIAGVDSSNAWFYADNELLNMVKILGDAKKTIYVFTWLHDRNGKNYRQYVGFNREMLEKFGFMADGDIVLAYERSHCEVRLLGSLITNLD